MVRISTWHPPTPRIPSQVTLTFHHMHFPPFNPRQTQPFILGFWVTTWHAHLCYFIMGPLWFVLSNFREAPRAASTLHEFIYFSLNNSLSSLPQQYSFSILLTLPNPLLFSVHLFNHFLTDYTVIIAKCQELHQLVQMPLSSILSFSENGECFLLNKAHLCLLLHLFIQLASVVISTFNPVFLLALCLHKHSVSLTLKNKSIKLPFSLKLPILFHHGPSLEGSLHSLIPSCVNVVTVIFWSKTQATHSVWINKPLRMWERKRETSSVLGTPSSQITVLTGHLCWWSELWNSPLIPPLPSSPPPLKHSSGRVLGGICYLIKWVTPPFWRNAFGDNLKTLVRRKL